MNVFQTATNNCLMKHSEQIVSGWWWATGSMSPWKASQLDKEMTEGEVGHYPRDGLLQLWTWERSSQDIVVAMSNPPFQSSWTDYDRSRYRSFTYELLWKIYLEINFVLFHLYFHIVIRLYCNDYMEGVIIPILWNELKKKFRYNSEYPWQVKGGAS